MMVVNNPLIHKASLVLEGETMVFGQGAAALGLDQLGSLGRL